MTIQRKFVKTYFFDFENLKSEISSLGFSGNTPTLEATGDLIKIHTPNKAYWLLACWGSIF